MKQHILDSKIKTMLMNRAMYAYETFIIKNSTSEKKIKFVNRQLSKTLYNLRRGK